MNSTCPVYKNKKKRKKTKKCVKRYHDSSLIVEYVCYEQVPRCVEHNIFFVCFILLEFYIFLLFVLFFRERKKILSKSLSYLNLGHKKCKFDKQLKFHTKYFE